jgi:transposase InsO family protein
MSAAISAATGRRYGVERVCLAWEVARSSVYAQQARTAAPVVPLRRRGPQGACADVELLAAIRAVLAASPFLGEGHRKVWARLRVQGLRTSKDRVRRLMREHGLLAPTRLPRVRGPRVHDGSIIPERPDVLWGTDLTGTMTVQDGAVSVFVCVDHHTAECLGIHAAKRATRWEALEPLRQGVRAVFGRVTENVAAGLCLRHDHGSQYVSDDFQDEVAFLGIASSPSFVRAPEGNGCAERLIRTLKEQLLWVRTFETVEALRQALQDWKQLYNEAWLVERHGYSSPAQVRRAYNAAQMQQAA